MKLFLSGNLEITLCLSTTASGAIDSLKMTSYIRNTKGCLGKNYTSKIINGVGGNKYFTVMKSTNFLFLLNITKTGMISSFY